MPSEGEGVRGCTDLVGVAVAEEEVGRFDVGMNILMLVDVLQYIQLRKGGIDK